MEIFNETWNTMVKKHKIIKKKNKIILMKSAKFNPEGRDAVLEQYYYKQQIDYCGNLKFWKCYENSPFFRRNSSLCRKDTKLNSSKRIKFSGLKEKSRVSKRFKELKINNDKNQIGIAYAKSNIAKKPILKYVPTEEELTTLIIKSMKTNV